MKKLLILFIFPLVFIQCQSEPSGSALEEDTQIDDPTTYHFMSEEGGAVQINYYRKAAKEYARIDINNTVLDLPKISEKGKGEYFKKPYHLVIEEGYALYDEGNGHKNRLELVAPIIHTFESLDKQTKVSVYYDRSTGQTLANITLPNQSRLQLPQVKAWNIGAEYSNGEYQWVEKSNTFLLIKKGDIPVVYKLKK